MNGSRQPLESKMTFEELRNVAAAIGPLMHGSLADRVDDVLDRARINADDTCFVEKSLPADQYDAAALETVCMIMTYRDTDTDVREWFASKGVKG